MAKAKEPQELTLTLGAEERRQRVEAVRKLDKDLAQIENALLDAAARLPALIREVGRARKVIAANTAPPSASSPESTDDEAS